jgi:hypothetical protein
MSGYERGSCSSWPSFDGEPRIPRQGAPRPRRGREPKHSPCGRKHWAPVKPLLAALEHFHRLTSPLGTPRTGSGSCGPATGRGLSPVLFFARRTWRSRAHRLAWIDFRPSEPETGVRIPLGPFARDEASLRGWDEARPGGMAAKKLPRWGWIQGRSDRWKKGWWSQVGGCRVAAVPGARGRHEGCGPTGGWHEHGRGLNRPSRVS